MNINWKTVGAVGTIIAGACVLHGPTSRKWRDIHTFGVLLGLAAAAAPRLGL